MKKYLKSKIHGIKVTAKKIDYEGSIVIDNKIMDEAEIEPYEIVYVVDVCNGERFETYALPGEEGECTLLGGAARRVEIGDKLLVFSYIYAEKKEKTKILIIEDNKIKEIKCL